MKIERCQQSKSLTHESFLESDRIEANRHFLISSTPQKSYCEVASTSFSASE
jgi:hypothetical protein